MKEWKFTEDSKDVDIDRLYDELISADLSDIPNRPPLLCRTPSTLEIKVYLEQLKTNAPRGYARFSKKYQTVGCIKV